MGKQQTSRLERNADIIRILSKMKKETQQSVVPFLRRDTILALVECVKNIIIRNVPLSDHQLSRLRQHERELKELVRSKTSRNRRVQILQSGNGILTAIIAPIASLIGGLIAAKKRR